MKNLFDHLAINKITPNGWLVLYATYHNYSYHNYVNFKHEQHRLEVTGFLTSSNQSYTITDQGLHLIREMENMINPPQSASTKKKNLPFEEWEEQIKKYNELFPAAKKPDSNFYFRTNPKELFSRFKWFFLEYPEYTWEDVFKATIRYVKGYEDSNNYTYMQLNKYFIKKDDKNKSTVSSLATEIYNLQHGADGEINTGTYYFGP